MADDREKFMNKANNWLEGYNGEIQPYLKSNFLYSPGTVARLMSESGMLTYYLFTFELFDNLTDREKGIKEGLERASEEMYALLEERQKDFMEYHKAIEDTVEMLHEDDHEPIELDEMPDDIETIFEKKDNSDLLS